MMYTEHRTQFLQHIDSIDPHIQFTAKGPLHRWICTLFGHPYYIWTRQHITHKSTGNLATQTSTFIGKATTTLMLSSVFSAPLHIEQDLCVQTHSYYKKERGISGKELTKVQVFPIGPSLSSNCRRTTNIIPATKTTSNKNKSIHMVVLYTKRLSESLKKTWQNGVQLHFKGGNSIRNLLVPPQTRTPSHGKCIRYRYKCGRFECDEYIGESARTFG